MEEGTVRNASIGVGGMLPLGSIRSLLEQWPSGAKGVVAIDDDGKHTAAEVLGRAQGLAAVLERDYGLASGQCVVLAIPNCARWLSWLCALQYLGARTLLVSPGISQRECTDVCERADAALTLPSKGFDVTAAPVGAFAYIEDVEAAAAQEPAKAGQWSTTDHSAVAEICMLTSGSTGKPKIIVHAFGAFDRNAKLLAASLLLDPFDAVFVPVPFSHVFGIVGLYACLESGSRIVTCEYYRPQTAVDLIDKAQVTVHLGVATMYIREHRVNDGKSKFVSLRAGLVAGAGCPAAVIEDWQREYGCTIVQSYGMSETAATFTTTPLSESIERRCVTSGVPIAGCSAKIDPNNSEVLVRSESIMKGILVDGALVPPALDDEGYFRTGDLGTIDEEGFLNINGRLKDCVIRGGMNICPHEIEMLYGSFDGMLECCVIGVPDPDLGQRTCLYCVLREDVKLAPAEIRLWASGKVEKCKIPDYVVPLPKLPTLSNGKIDKSALLRLFKN